MPNKTTASTRTRTAGIEHQPVCRASRRHPSQPGLVEGRFLRRVAPHGRTQHQVIAPVPFAEGDEPLLARIEIDEHLPGLRPQPGGFEEIVEVHRPAGVGENLRRDVVKRHYHVARTGAGSDPVEHRPFGVPTEGENDVPGPVGHAQSP